MTIHVPFAGRSEVSEPANDLALRSLLTRSDSDADLSITWVAIDGRHRRLRTDASTRVYVVLEGAGIFAVDGHAPVEATAGDLVVVPLGCGYDLVGTMTYLVINQPGFRPGDDVYLDGDRPPDDRDDERQALSDPDEEDAPWRT